MDLKITGLKELERKLKEMERNARAIDGTNQVPVTDMFPPVFMRRYTDVGSFEELIETGGFTVETPEDFKAIPDAPLCQHGWDICHGGFC